jgi:hypothetical protein
VPSNFNARVVLVDLGAALPRQVDYREAFGIVDVAKKNVVGGSAAVRESLDAFAVQKMAGR